LKVNPQELENTKVASSMKALVEHPTIFEAYMRYASAGGTSGKKFGILLLVPEGEYQNSPSIFLYQIENIAGSHFMKCAMQVCDVTQIP